jgi:hypothetical protein
VRKATYNFLDHIHNLLLDQIQALCVSSGCPTNDVVNLDVIVILTDTAPIHGVGELDEHRIFLHDTLDVLTTDADDTLVILIRNMKGDGRGHLLLYQIEPILCRLILSAADIDVEIIFIETVEYYLHITWCHRYHQEKIWLLHSKIRSGGEREEKKKFFFSNENPHTLPHYLIDLAILLAAYKFFVFVCEFDLHTYLVGAPLDKRDLIDDHHCCLDGIIRSVDRERQIFEANIST